jgi:iron(III) transport system substrate-binding protein
MRRVGLLILLAALTASACSQKSSENKSSEDSKVVRVYTSRHYGIEPVFEAFTNETGIRIEFTTGGDAELRERLQAEGPNTPADVFMTVDAANLYLAAEAGLLADFRSAILEETIPENLRDPNGRWYALSLRVRAIAYSPERVSASELSTYEALGDPKWKKRLCLRPATHPYTVSLVAGMIASDGAPETQRVIESWVANEPEYINSDVELLKNVAAGRCDVTLVNSYYLARLLNEDPSFAVKIFWPNQDGRGAHVNISGAGVTSHAKNKEGAQRLIEWLATSGQRQFADANFEFPANPAVAPAPILASWGEFKKDPIWVGELGRLQPEAVKVLDRAGYL